MKSLKYFIAAGFFCFATFATASSNCTGIMASNGCVNCHGYEGRDNAIGSIPPLKGRSQEFLTAAMYGYKNGTLRGTVMNRVMRDFDDKQIIILADYFSSIK